MAARLGQAGLALGVTLVCLAAAEWVLRTDYFLYDSPWRVFVPTHQLGETGFFLLTGDPALPYRLAPGTRKTFWWGGEVETNERGWLLDAESSAESPNLLIAGDSVAFGLGVAAEDGFPARLRRAFPDARVAVLAAPGYNTAHEVEWIRRVVSRGLFRPDVVVLQLGLNDYLEPDRILERDGHHFYQRVPTRSPWPPASRYTALLERYELAFRASRGLARLLGGRVALHDVPDRGARFATALDELRALASEHFFVLIVANVPYARRTPPEARFARAIEPAFAGLSHRLDLGPELRGSKDVWFDRMHPNGEGHRRIAERLRIHLEANDLMGGPASPGPRRPSPH